MRTKIAMNAHAKEDTQQRHAYGRHTKPDKRTWLHIDIHGISQDLEVGKHVIMRRAHLPARDLRLLDPLLSYPSSILGRERAIVVNLEHIKTIITAQEVFLLDSHNPIVAPFVQDLRCRLPSNHSNQTSPEGCGPGCEHHPEDREGGDTTITNSHEDPSIDHSQSREKSDRVDLSMSGTKVEIPSEILAQEPSELQLHHKHSKWACPLSRGQSLLPFEFRALEACLEAACHRLNSEASDLARDAHSALEALTSHVSARTLETVRQIKNQLVLISGRTQRVRDEIEHLLDDDGDMAEMYLTDKMLRQQLEGSPSLNNSETRSQSSLHGDGAENTATSSYPEVTLEDTLKYRQETNSQEQPSSGALFGLQPANSRQQKARHSPWRDHLSPPRNKEHHKQEHGFHLHHSNLHQSKSSPAKQTREHLKLVSFHEDHANHDSLQSKTSSVSCVTGANGKRHDVEELEMLLEAYFVLIDGIIHHVTSVKEYVDDTEDYVKIRLDDHQNTLLKVNVVLTVSTLVIGLFIVITGIFGMNISIPLFNEGKARDFWAVVGISSAASIVLSALIIGWCKYTHFI